MVTLSTPGVKVGTVVTQPRVISTLTRAGDRLKGASVSDIQMGGKGVPTRASHRTRMTNVPPLHHHSVRYHSSKELISLGSTSARPLLSLGGTLDRLRFGG